MVESTRKQLEVRPKKGKLLIAFCVFVLGLCVGCWIYLNEWRGDFDSAVSGTNQTIDESGSPAGAPNHERGSTQVKSEQSSREKPDVAGQKDPCQIAGRKENRRRPRLFMNLKPNGKSRFTPTIRRQKVRRSSSTIIVIPWLVTPP